MGITKCNTMDAMWRLASRCGDDSGGGKISTNLFNHNENFYLLSTNDM